jgi:hypothetical protein
MNHGVEFGHVRAVSASCRHRSTHLDVKICGAKHVTSAPQAVAPSKGSKNEMKSSKGLNVNIFQKGLVGVSRPGGSLSRRVSVPRAPAQMGQARGRARRGEGEVAGDGRERGGNPAAFVFVLRPGRVRLQ